MLLSNAGGDGKLRKQIRRRHTDKRGSARQLPLGLDDVRPPAQEIDRQPGTDTRRQSRKHAGPRQLAIEVLGKLADQHSDCVARRVDARDQRRDLRLQLRELALRQRNVEFVGDATAIALLNEVDVFLRNFDVFAQHRKLHLQCAQIEIGAGHVGDERDEHHVARGDCGIHVILRRFEGAAEFAEHVDLPGRVEAGDVVDLRHAGAVLGRHQRLRSTAAGEVASRAPCSSIAALGHRQRRAEHDGFLGARLLDPVKSDFEGRAAGDGAIDQCIEFTIVQRAPPFGAGRRHGSRQPWRMPRQ